jgi:E3 ubiquitin-protein ligase RNF115/126
MTDFQQMFGTTFDPSFQSRQAGRSRPEALFAQAPFVGGFRIGGGGGSGTHMGGGRFTFTTRRVRPVDGAQSGIPLVNDLSVYVSPLLKEVISDTAPSDPLPSIIESMFGPLGDQGDYEGLGGVPLGLHGLFQALPNPADARSVDAMYEVWGQIMSIVMELHSTSDAPGPASPDAIAALPKKKLDEKMLGPEGKGECVVCMDDVHIGDEVVLLPCSHWFHEACAASWLSEHNTCPICRRGIEGETALPK